MLPATKIETGLNKCIEIISMLAAFGLIFVTTGQRHTVCSIKTKAWKLHVNTALSAHAYVTQVYV